MLSSSKTKKNQILYTVVGILFLIAFIIFGMWFFDPNKDKPSPLEIAEEKREELMNNYTARPTGSVTIEDTWITKSEKRIQELETENKQLQKTILEIEKRLRTNEQQTEKNKQVVSSTKLTPPPVSNLPNTNFTVNKPLPPPPSPKTPNPVSQQSVVPAPPGSTSSEISRIQVIDLTVKKSSETNDKGTVKNVSRYLPAGSFAKAVLLSGIDAPTGGQAESQPIPVLLRIMDLGQLPNYWKSDMQDCHITGAAYGNISSERAHIRLELLSCVLIDGNIIEQSLQGYVAGEDGKAGLRGRIVSKQGSLIAKSLLAGIFASTGSAVSQQYSQVSSSPLGTVTTIDSDKVLEAGVLTGTGNALNKIADYYIARANEIYPIIEVDANRIGEIILLGGTDLGENLIGNTRSKPQ